MQAGETEAANRDDEVETRIDEQQVGIEVLGAGVTRSSRSATAR